MDKYDILLIRVCKANLSSKETVRRLVRVWRLRCWLPSEYKYDACIVYVTQHLWELIEKYQLSSLTKVINQLLNSWEYDDYPVNPKLKFILGQAVSSLAHSEVKKLDGFIAPAFFRNGGYEKKLKISS